MSSRGKTGGHMASSFTDLMASLMVIFLLLFVAYSNNTTQSRLDAPERAVRALEADLGEIEDRTVRVERDPRERSSLVVVMPDSLLFARGSAVVLDSGRKYLDRFVPEFARVLGGEPPGTIEAIVVEGHTDTTWAGRPGDPRSAETGRAFNLELSQNRSLAVVKLCLESLRGNTDRARFLTLVSASGRGQEELLAGFPGDAPQQRRVVFKVRLRADALPRVREGLPVESALVTAQR